VNWKGQAWLSREQLAERHKLVWRDDLGLTGIGLDPDFAIASALYWCLTGTAACSGIAFRSQAVKRSRKSARSAVSRQLRFPIPITTALSPTGARRLGEVPIYLHGDDAQWVTRPHKAIVPWSGDNLALSDGVTLLRTGGHFAGGTILHWRAGAEGRGALLTGDVAMVAADRRSLSFMYSYPNYIPLNAAAVQRIAQAVAPLRVRSHLWRMVGQEHCDRRQGGVSTSRSGAISMRSRADGAGLSFCTLATWMVSLYLGFREPTCRLSPP
jgi:hypothetical protein